MPPTVQQIQGAQAVQRAAAHDARPQVRLVAGPGTGKSFSIEERVNWLLTNGINAQRLFAVSFTRAAAQDLARRIRQFCHSQGQVQVDDVSVTTLHSLALRVLRRAGMLARFPADPRVMDQWELDEIFDAEFSEVSGLTPSRCEKIRREYEAFWSTGTFAPPNFIPPTPPISQAERDAFAGFHQPSTQVYSCVLPGEIIRHCVIEINAGNLDPVALLRIAHLIVDEFQDLNPLDQQFIEILIGQNVTTFIAGDDDQSIYSFRFALPQGIQDFMRHHPQAGTHTLGVCFRCTTNVLASARTLIGANPPPNQIQKNLQSVYNASAPPVAGTVLRWRFNNGAQEAQAIAQSCQRLIEAGLAPSDLLILISDRNILAREICRALDALNVAYESPSSEGFVSLDEGRLLMAILRVVENPNDYLAHRTLLGLQSGVGIGTCGRIRAKTFENNLNYRDLFYQPPPAGVFSTREVNAIGRIAAICARISTWQATDELRHRVADIGETTGDVLGASARANIDANMQALPPRMTLEELRDFLSTTDEEVQYAILTDVYQRMGQDPPAAINPIPRVRMMTMHGAKGLSARVVFVPGLEEEVFPGPRRRPYPGLVQEAARLLYVSITRARAACVLTYAQGRVVHGQFTRHSPSRFARSVGGAFSPGTGGITSSLAARIAADCAAL